MPTLGECIKECQHQVQVYKKKDSMILRDLKHPVPDSGDAFNENVVQTILRDLKQ